MRRLRPALLLSTLALTACAGGGDGNLTGTLLLRGCNAQGDGAPPPEQPAPFSLDPTYFAAEPLRRTIRYDVSPYNVDRLVVRLQRTAYRPERADSLLLMLYDVDGLRASVGKPIELTSAPLELPEVPQPTTGKPRISAALALSWTCPYLQVQPALRGTITVNELGFEHGEWIDARLTADVEDLRGEREGVPAEQRAAGGRLDGWFRFQITPSRAIVMP